MTKAPFQDIADDFERIDPRDPYFAQLKKMIRFDVLAKAKGNFAYDAVHGCGAGWLDRILSRPRHDRRIHPHQPRRAVRRHRPRPFGRKSRAAEKAGAGKEVARRPRHRRRRRPLRHPRSRRHVSFSRTTFSVWSSITCSKRAAEKLGASRSVATTHLIDAVARLHGVKIYETPVGFKYVGPLLREDKIALGGEESAGMTIHGHLPEKDGILACLLVAEMIAARQTSLGDQLRDLFRRVGAEFWPVRENLHLPAETQAKLPERLRENFNEFAGHQVAKTDRTDGLQLIFDDGSWILMRPSGTEPVVRIYTEARRSSPPRKNWQRKRAHGSPSEAAGQKPAPKNQELPLRARSFASSCARFSAETALGS